MAVVWPATHKAGCKTMADRLNDKVIIVTGGASGIGAACASVFAAEGAKVSVCDINEEGALTTVRRVGEQARFIALDTSNESDWANAIDSTLAHFGAIDGVANIAGIAARTITWRFVALTIGVTCYE